MPRPQFYYEDGGLFFDVTPPEDGLTPLQQQWLDELSGIPACDIAKPNDRQIVSTDVQALAGPPEQLNRGNRIGKFIKLVDGLLNFPLGDDAVLGLTELDRPGMTVQVYPYFQSWLTESGINQQVAREARVAMASIFNPNDPRLTINQNGIHGGDLAVGADQIEYHVSKTHETQEGIYDLVATAELVTPTLRTIGNCACLGPKSWRRIRNHPEYPYLYELESHNVDTWEETLSLLLGAGLLVHRAINDPPKSDWNTALPFAWDVRGPYPIP